jgi:hypothetical protein
MAGHLNFWLPVFALGDDGKVIVNVNRVRCVVASTVELATTTVSLRLIGD